MNEYQLETIFYRAMGIQCKYCFVFQIEFLDKYRIFNPIGSSLRTESDIVYSRILNYQTFFISQRAKRSY